MRKVFTELDLYQNYNNIWIKKRNEWKVVLWQPLDTMSNDSTNE